MANSRPQFIKMHRSFSLVTSHWLLVASRLDEYVQLGRLMKQSPWHVEPVDLIMILLDDVLVGVEDNKDKRR